MAKTKFTVASDNIFADLSLPDADEYLGKADLAIEIIRIIHERKLSQKDAAIILGIDQPKVSKLIRGKLDGFSIDRLFRFVTLLGKDLEIKLSDSPAGTGRVMVRSSQLAKTPSHFNAITNSPEHVVIGLFIVGSGGQISTGRSDISLTQNQEDWRMASAVIAANSRKGEWETW